MCSGIALIHATQNQKNAGTTTVKVAPATGKDGFHIHILFSKEMVHRID
jgi:hypothetical protein